MSDNLETDDMPNPLRWLLGFMGGMLFLWVTTSVTEVFTDIHSDILRLQDRVSRLESRGSNGVSEMRCSFYGSGPGIVCVGENNQ